MIRSPRTPLARRRLVGRLALIAALAALGAAGACAHPVPVTEPGAAAAADSAPAPTLPVFVVVENHHLSDVVVSVTHGGLTNRLGTVTASGRATLPIRAGWLAPADAITITARAVGGSASFQSAPLIVRGGQRIELTLESGLQRSSVAVY